MTIATDPCMMQFAQNVVSRVKFPLNQQKVNRFTAGIVIDQKAEIDSRVMILIGNIINFLFFIFNSDF